MDNWTYGYIIVRESTEQMCYKDHINSIGKWEMLSIKKLRFFLVDRYYTNVVLIFPRHMFEEPKADLSSLSEILHEYFIISIQRIHSKGAFTFALPRSNLVVKSTYRSQTTGSEGVSFRLPQLFFSQHRLKRNTQKLASKLQRLLSIKKRKQFLQ